MPDPNNILLADDGLVFALPCKNANTSVKLALLKHQGRNAPEPENPPQYGVHQAELFDYIDLEDTPENAKVIGVIREPMSRILSMFNFTRTPQRDFSYWIRDQAHRADYESDQHVRSQFWELTHDGKFMPQLLLYCDDLENDWAAFENLVGWDHHGISHANTLEQNGITAVIPTNISDESRDAIYSRYGMDFFLYDAMRTLKASDVWSGVETFKRLVGVDGLKTLPEETVH